MKDELGPDEQIIKGVLKGNVDGFRLVVNRYQEKIFSIGMRFFKNEEDSRDFVQEVFIKAYHQIKSYRGLAPFRFWLTRIAYNHGINMVKTRKEEGNFSEDSLSTHQTPEVCYLREEMRNVLLVAINQLPEEYRICLDLYFFWGLTYSQISEITEFPVNTIKSNVFRAKQVLRDSLRGTIVEDYHEM
jgi:RNA polymerase sigma-70 factor (ECF subfamily)